ncbi:hypothetical protein [Gimibacter soli]|uniref:Uncharacterized protein n=1 Tax=Gimibacter soli TaxID=3024400 RepID=A0AAE9XQ36_9PROT|nr:hypothetical protein [Gimibacter soli]WCL52855.1 hypothetical protein PH603_09915 [Gimibacter soli]
MKLGSRLMRSLGQGVLAGGLLTAFTLPAAAQSASLIDDKVIAEIREILAHPVVQMTVRSQNRKYGNLAQSEIDKLDAQWVQERQQDDQPLIAAALNNPASMYLTQIQAESLGLFTEIFITDQNGLNAGQSSITSDYWQGDEAKFKNTFGVGPSAVFVDEPERDDDTKTVRSQANVTITDESGRAIGHATFEVNLTELARRQ